MKHVVLSLVIFYSLVSAVVANDTLNKVDVDPIYDEKVVLCEIDFMPNSAVLSEQAKTVLDGVLLQLQSIDTTDNTIRIEGFPSLSDTDDEPARLSLTRAVAVEEYYRFHHNATFERFLTGHKDQGPDCLVKIVVYENPWKSDTSEIQVASKDGGNGSS